MASRAAGNWPKPASITLELGTDWLPGPDILSNAWNKRPALKLLASWASLRILESQRVMQSQLIAERPAMLRLRKSSLLRTMFKTRSMTVVIGSGLSPLSSCHMITRPNCGM